MLKPYDIEILPCVFYQLPYHDEGVSSVSGFNRKRVNTMDSKTQQLKLLMSINENPFLNSSFHNNLKLKAKWVGQSRTQQQQDMIKINKKVFDNLLQQNRLKEEKIILLQEKLNQLESKHEDRSKGNLSHRMMDNTTNNTFQNTKLKQLSDYNNTREKKKPIKSHNQI